MPFLRAFFALSAVLSLALVLAGAAAGQPPRVLAVEFENDVNPVTQEYLIDAIDRAEDEGFAAVILLVDTPGGLDSSMRAIIKRELDAAIPVVLYVYPPGSRAASADLFIAQAADIAAMAPQTNIGSADNA